MTYEALSLLFVGLIAVVVAWGHRFLDRVEKPGRVVTTYPFYPIPLRYVWLVVFL